ncbi:MAG: diguanylate cyclase [Syntrophomonas sp.]
MVKRKDDQDIDSKTIEPKKENRYLKKDLTKPEIHNIKEQRGGPLQALNIIAYGLNDTFLPLYYIGAVDGITGYSEADFLSAKVYWEQLIHPEDLQLYHDACQSLITSRKAQTFEYRIISGEGRIIWLKDMAVPILDESQNFVSIEGLIIDISQQKSIEEELLDRQAHLDSILNSVQDVIWSVSPDSFELLYISPAAEKVYGYTLDEFYDDALHGNHLLKSTHEMIIDNFSTLIHQGWFEVEFCIELPNGQNRWLHRRAHFAHDAHGSIARIDGIDVDITRRKQAEDSLRYISLHDYLTGLYNRFYFEKEMLAIDETGLDSAGLIVCDVDGLKLINDNLGHEAGDTLLRDCAQVLNTCFNQDEIISRIGGDEFTIIIKNCSLTQLEESVAKLEQTIVEHNLGKPSYPLSLSIGHALKSSPDNKMRNVFRVADNLMYAEKPEKRRSFKKLFRSLKI